jgi:hypothetical protein
MIPIQTTLRRRRNQPDETTRANPKTTIIRGSSKVRPKTTISITKNDR